MGMVADVNFDLLTNLQTDFKKADTEMNPETLKAFILGALFFRQVYEKNQASVPPVVEQTLQETLEHVADIADSLEGVG